jgi:hypothetical protein
MEKKIVHNLFEHQPINNADVYLVRAVLHDYPDELCIKILRLLRSAAKPSTQLLIVDDLIFHACADPVLYDIPGAKMFDPPAPLLPNLGAANLTGQLIDIDVSSHILKHNYKNINFACCR